MTMPLGGEPGQLRKNLTTAKIVFLIISAAAPLGAVVGTVPLAFSTGNGPGLPAIYLFAGLTLLCFSVGYAAMGRQLVNVGGFYTYLAHGLGRTVAVVGGFVAVIAYNAMTIGVLGVFSYFAQTTAQSHGLDLPWQVWMAAGILVTGVLGYRRVDLSARLVALLMLGEIAALLCLDLAILVDKGADALPAASFDPAIVLSGGIGVAMMYTFTSFIGFESAALYGEEARDPRRSVPLATYIAVTIIALFYALTSWLAVGGVGVNQVRAQATTQLGDLFFGLSDRYLTSAVTSAIQILLCTSLFAAMLSLHNAVNRYVYAVGRERVLPKWLSAVHREHQSPHRASLAQTALTVAVTSAFAIGGIAPYPGLAASMLSIGTLGIVLVQGGAAVAVVAYFRNRPDRHWWRTVLAPVLGAAGLITAVVLLVVNYSLLTGTEAPIVNNLPWLFVIVAIGGAGYVRWLRSARPDRYRRLATRP